MQLNKETHLKVMLGTMSKAFKNARRKGTYSVKNLYFLNCIYKTLKMSCAIGISEDDKRELCLFYYKVLNSSREFCKQDLQSEAFKSNQFLTHLTVQDIKLTGDHAPEVDDFIIGDEGSVEYLGVFVNTFSNQFV
jgi:hypothetical protein